MLTEQNDAVESAETVSDEFEIPTETDAAVEESAQEEEEKEPFVKVLFSWIDDLALYFIAFMLIMSFLLRPCTVDGNSMLRTLYDGDVLLLSVLPTEPERGDIVVITRENVKERPLIKRVIGVSGDRVMVDYTTNTVYVNGNAIDEPYLDAAVKAGAFGEMRDAFTLNTEFVVPDGSVYVMGDNRNDSTDSRSRDVGALEKGQILGKVVFRLYHDTKNGGPMFGTVK